jgi:HEPN domain-containing protein
MNLNVLVSQVRGLRRTADDLLAEFDRSMQPSARPATPDEEDRFVASVLVMPILRALAAELSLKAISIKRSGKFDTGHDLRKLYDALDDDTRNRIKQKAAAKWMDPIQGTLTKHKDDFVAWRYAGEDKTLNTNPSDLDEAVEVLMAVYEEAEPRTESPD